MSSRSRKEKGSCFITKPIVDDSLLFILLPLVLARLSAALLEFKTFKQSKCPYAPCCSQHCVVKVSWLIHSFSPTQGINILSIAISLLSNQFLLTSCAGAVQTAASALRMTSASSPAAAWPVGTPTRPLCSGEGFWVSWATWTTSAVPRSTPRSSATSTRSGTSWIR